MLFRSAIALYLTCGDFEHGGEVYGCASDRQQASIVFDVAVDMVEQCPALKSRIKPMLSQKRLVYKPLGSFYQVLSAEAYTKHGLTSMVWYLTNFMLSQTGIFMM